MNESGSPRPELLEAIQSYMLTLRMPEVAELMREQRTHLIAASEALRALISAAEEWSGSVVYPSALKTRHAALLKAHQATWLKAFRTELSSQCDHKIRHMFDGVWKQAFLPVLLDRSEKYAGITEMGAITWIRIFGIPMSMVSAGTILITDRITSLFYDFTLTGKGGETLSADVRSPLLPIAVALDRLLMHKAQQGQPDTNFGQSAQRILYSYGPIGNNDQEVRIEAMRDAAASVDYMIKLMDFCTQAYTNKKFLSMAHVYRYLDTAKISTADDTAKISTADFHRALSPLHKVELHALEVARNRAKAKRTR